MDKKERSFREEIDKTFNEVTKWSMPAIGLGGLLNALYERSKHKGTAIQKEGQNFPIDEQYTWSKSFTRGMGETFVLVAEMALLFGTLKLLFPLKKRQAVELTNNKEDQTDSVSLDIKKTMTPDTVINYRNNWQLLEQERDTTSLSVAVRE